MMASRAKNIAFSARCLSFPLFHRVDDRAETLQTLLWTDSGITTMDTQQLDRFLTSMYPGVLVSPQAPIASHRPPKGAYS